MSIKILLLKSGEDVIADVQEMVNDQEQVIGYLLNKPCVVKVRNTRPGVDITPDQTEFEDDTKPDNKTAITMYPWVPLAKDKTIPLSLDWVVTMYTAQEKVEEMYTQDVVNNFKENDQTDSITGSTKTGLTD